jgi:hypothetical protein
MNKKTPGVTPDESHMCEEVLEGHSPGHVVLGDHNGHKPYEYLECGENVRNMGKLSVFPNASISKKDSH